ncbi:hypothetical protein PZA11_006856 [Diplocarpon coronariae]
MNTEIETKLDLSNYWEWEPTIVQSLAGNGCLAWAFGPVPQRPADAKANMKWEKKNKEAIITIVQSLTPMISRKYQNEIIAHDANALWNAIKNGESKVVNNSLAHFKLLKEFYEAKYNPYAESLEEYVLRLSNIQARLQGYYDPPNDSQLKERMIRGLPTAGMWITIQLVLRGTDKSLQETIIDIQAYEETYKNELKVTPIATQSAALNTEATSSEANFSRGGSRGRGRGGRYRGRGNRGRGGIQKGGKCHNRGKTGHWKAES